MRAEARFLLMAVDRPPPLWFGFSPGGPSSFSGGGPCGKVGNAASSRFPLFHQGVVSFLFCFFFLTNNPRFRRLFHSYASSSGAPTIAIGGVRPRRPALRFSDR